MTWTCIGGDKILVGICIIKSAVQEDTKTSITRKLLIEADEIFCTHLVNDDLYDQFWLRPQATKYTAD